MTDYEKMNCEQLEAVIADHDKKIKLLLKVYEQESECRRLTFKLQGLPPESMSKQDVECLSAIRKATCEEFGISERILTMEGRTEAIIVPRQAAMYLSYKPQERSLSTVGLFYGKDHGTVMNACRVIKSRIGEPKFRARIERIEAKLKGQMVNGEK